MDEVGRAVEWIDDPDVLGFLDRPIACSLLVVALVIFAGSAIAGIRNKRGMLANDVE